MTEQGPYRRVAVFRLPVARISAFVVCMAWVSSALLPQQPAAREVVRGVTVSTHRSGQEWAADSIAGTFADVRSLGANWVAIHPYARIADDGSIRFPAIDSAHPPETIVRPIREAHALGLKILIKPHLAYWGSRFDWRGAICFESDQHWQRFWTDYRTWILEVAAVAADADAFAVGTELDRTLHFDDRWRSLIREVRARTGARLTYAANWTDFEQVGFWDALDSIGIQAYFPLSDSDRPNEAELVVAWRDRMKSLAGFAERLGKDIVFTELGYNQSFSAAREPWSSRSDGPEAAELQRLCMRVALAAIEEEPRVVGAFLWKWFPRPRPAGRDFRLAYPEMEEVIRSIWK